MKKKNWVILGRQQLLQILLTVCLIFLFGWGMLINEQWELTGMAAVTAGYALVCLLGGLYGGIAAEKKKYLQGAAGGAVYFLLLLLLSVSVNGSLSSDGRQLIARLLVCTAGGLLGGILGGLCGK